MHSDLGGVNLAADYKPDFSAQLERQADVEVEHRTLETQPRGVTF